MAFPPIIDWAGPWIRRVGILATGGGGVLLGHPVIACIASVSMFLAPGLKVIAAWGWSMFRQPDELAVWIEGWAKVSAAIVKVRDAYRAQRRK